MKPLICRCLYSCFGSIMNRVLGVLGYEVSYLQMFVFLFWECNEPGVGSVGL
jgi:hypothetical protein